MFKTSHVLSFFEQSATISVLTAATTATASSVNGSNTIYGIERTKLAIR